MPHSSEHKARLGKVHRLRMNSELSQRIAQASLIRSRVGDLGRLLQDVMEACFRKWKERAMELKEATPILLCVILTLSSKR